MKATFLRVSEGGKIAVSGEHKPHGPNYWARVEIEDTVNYEKAMQSFSDSFVELAKDKIFLTEILPEKAYNLTSSGLAIDSLNDGLYPIQGLEFEIIGGNNSGFLSCCKPNECYCGKRRAIVSLVEPSKEVHYSENPELGGRFTERLGEKNPTEDEIAEFIKTSFQLLVGFNKYRMMDYILDSKFRVILKD